MLSYAADGGWSSTLLLADVAWLQHVLDLITVELLWNASSPTHVRTSQECIHSYPCENFSGMHPFLPMRELLRNASIPTHARTSQECIHSYPCENVFAPAGILGLEEVGSKRGGWGCRTRPPRVDTLWYLVKLSLPTEKLSIFHMGAFNQCTCVGSCID